MNHTSIIKTAAQLINEPNCATHFLDASFYLPAAQQDPETNFGNCHLPNARRFNIDTIALDNSPYPHMLPTAEAFTKVVQRLNISTHSAIGCYEQASAMGAARAWWMFRVFGHPDSQLSIIDAGWEQELGTANESHNSIRDDRRDDIKGDFVAKYRPDLVACKEDILTAINTNSSTKQTDIQIIDARSPERFSGIAPEPRAGLRSGHMPTAINLPFKSCYQQNGQWLSPADLANLMSAKGIDPQKPTITTCGSGVTACVLALALYQLSNDRVKVYDGSWSEWGADHDLPISNVTSA